MQKAKEAKEKLKAEEHKRKEEEKVVQRHEVKSEYVPTEATIKQLFYMQQVTS